MSVQIPIHEKIPVGDFSQVGFSAAASTLLTVWWRLGFSLLLAAQGMLLGLAVNLGDIGPHETRVLHLLVGATSLGVIALLGWPLLEAIWLALIERTVCVELLFLTGIVGAFVASLQSVIAGTGPIYFEVISILLVVYTFNKMMIAQRCKSALTASQGWLQELQRARVLNSSEPSRWVPVASILPGQMVEVQPGETVPIDGVVERGIAFVRDTPLTGEPFPRVVREGDPLLAGSAVEDATLLLRATAKGSHRQIDQLLATVAEAARTSGILQRQADRLTRYFLPLVLIIAALTSIVWLAIDGWPAALMYSMSVLLIACPCALGLATPLATWSTLSLLASEGLVVRQADLLDALAKVDHVVFDKTGTLTEDQKYVVDVVTRSTGCDRTRILSWVAAIESRSNHPVARALATMHCEPNGHGVAHVEISIQPGCGIFARFDDAHGRSHMMRIGQLEWVGAENDRNAEAWLGAIKAKRSKNVADEDADEDASIGQVAVELNGQLEAICYLRERDRDTVGPAIDRLKSLGVRISVLTGDRVAGQSRNEFDSTFAQLDPQQKAEIIKRWQAAGASCLYVGDGINDAPALRVAHAAIALSSGAALAQATAPAVLHTTNLQTIPSAIEACRRATNTVQSNLHWAATYNALGMSLAACGFLHPVMAALLMVGSSLLVVSRSLRLREQFISH